MTRLNELEEQIKLLNLENKSLVERVEEMEVYALISKNFENVDNTKKIFAIALEKISIIKTIPYCGVFWIEKNKAVLDFDFSYLNKDSKLAKSFSFTKLIIKKILSMQHFYLDSTMKDFSKIKMKFSNNYLIPDCFLIVPFDTLGREGVFLFADNSKEHNLHAYANFLEHVVHLTRTKLTNIRLLNHINSQNDNLEQLVEEKSIELYESEAKYRELIEQLPDAIIIHNKGIIEFVNTAAVNLLEAASKIELIGNHIIDFINAESKEKVLQNMQSVLLGEKGKRTEFTEYTLTTLKRNKIFVEASGTKFYNFGENRIQVIVRDITERKLQEQKLKESEEKFRLAFEISPDAIAISRLEDGSYVSINKGFETICGYTDNEVKGVSSVNLNIWQNLKDREKLVNRIKIDGFVSDFKANFKMKDGTIRKGSMSAKIIKLNGVPHILSTTRDITEQEKINEIIEAKNNFLNAVINSISNPFVVVNPEDYSIILANPAAAEIGKIVGGKCYNDKHNHDDEFCNGDKCPLHQIKKTKNPYSIEREHIDANGNSRTFKILGYPVLDSNGELIQLIEYALDVSEQKTMMYDLKSSEQKFRGLFDKAVIGLALLDFNGKIVDTNKAALSIFGLKSNNVVGKYGLPLFAAKDRKYIFRQFKNIFIKGSLNFERTFVDANGKEKFIEILGSKLSDELIIVSFIDSTEQRLATLKLKESEEKFKSLIEQSPVGIVMIREGKILFANKVLSKMLGFSSEEELHNKSLIDFIPPDLKKLTKLREQKLKLSDRKVDAVEEQFVCKDGKIIDVLVLIQTIEYEGQQVTQEYIYDITEDKKLREENRILKFGIECIEKTAVLVLDPKGKITYANPGFTNIYGYTGEEVLGKELSIIKSFCMSKEFDKELEKNIKGHKSYYGEILNKTKDGTIINVEISLTPIFSSDKQFLGYIEIHNDVTERRKAEMELIKAKEAAEQADKVKSEFLAQMSHEIRTPINAIVSFSSLLKDELQDIVSDDLKTSFSLIDRAGNRIIRTIDLLLNLSEIHTGTYQCILKKLNLYDDVLSAVIVNYKYQARTKNLGLEVKLETEDVNVTADAYALEQIFKNLIDNAIKYTKEGKVEIVVSKVEDQLQVKISDTGVGISKEYLPRLFEPFSQEETGYTRSFEGNGIGLALVKEYCRLNNITINVKSEKRKGTMFTLIF